MHFAASLPDGVGWWMLTQFMRERTETQVQRQLALRMVYYCNNQCRRFVINACLIAVINARLIVVIKACLIIVIKARLIASPFPPHLVYYYYYKN